MRRTIQQLFDLRGKTALVTSWPALWVKRVPH